MSCVLFVFRHPQPIAERERKLLCTVIMHIARVIVRVSVSVSVSVSVCVNGGEERFSMECNLLIFVFCVLLAQKTFSNHFSRVCYCKYVPCTHTNNTRQSTRTHTHKQVNSIQNQSERSTKRGRTSSFLTLVHLLLFIAI